jgi:hypothetical protein
MTSAAELLARLRDPSDDAPSARLAALLVEDALARPVGELVDPGLVSTALQATVLAWTASDRGVATVVEEAERLRALLSAHEGPVAERVPAAVQGGLREFVQLPFVARRDSVMKLLDRQSFRQLVRAQLVETLADFGRKVASPMADNPIARGLGGLGKLAGQIAKPSGLGAIASAVSGEVERQIEKRAADFADTAVAGIISGIADQASDPARSAQQAALRLELLEGLLALTGADVGELAKGNLDRQVAVVRKALAAWAASGDLARDVEAPLRLMVERESARPLGALLDELGVLGPVSLHARSFVRAAVARVVAGDAFAAWLELAVASARE